MAIRVRPVRDFLTAITLLATVAVVNVGMSTPAAALTGNDAPAYPLKVSSNKHYLVDQNNQPFFVRADTAWSLMFAYTTAQATQYLEDRRLKGVNTVATFISGYAPTEANTDGDFPFISNDVTQPNAAYFSHVDDIVNIAASKGIQLYLGVANLGSGTSAYQSYITTTSQATSLGQYLGNRYKNFPNIIWVYGGDTSIATATSMTPIINAMAAGVQTFDTFHIGTYHMGSVHSSSEVFLGSSWHNFSSIQTYKNDDTVAPDAYELVYTDYKASTVKPTILIEPPYENVTPSGDSTTTPYLVRRQISWAATSGAFGISIGSEPFFESTLPGNWASSLNLASTVQAKYIADELTQYDWFTDVPDTNTSHNLVASGYGTYGTTTYATAMLASDGSHGWVYVPSTMSPVVNMAKFSGTVTAKWFDPTTGTASLIGTFANSGTHTFTSPSTTHSDGTADYFLELKAGSQREIARWRFDETSGSTAADSTGNGHTGTLVNAPSHVAGAVGDGLSLNGTNQYATAADANDLDFTSTIKADVWVKFTAGAGTVEQKVFVKDGSGGMGNSAYGVEVSAAGKIGLEWNAAWYYGNALTWSNGVWYHLVVQHDGSTISFIRDGVSAGSVANTSTNLTTTGQLFIGRGMTGFENYFDGIIDELQLSTN